MKVDLNKEGWVRVCEGEGEGEGVRVRGEG
jgi:hypothetical protein